MLYNKQELTPELFKNPTSEYRGTPFWSWNCKITNELIEKQIDVFNKMGFGGFHIHPRTGLETPYMSTEYIDYVKTACEKAKSLGMLCWLYDEDRYPSGAAGGIVTEDLRFRARHLLLTRSERDDMCRNAEEFKAMIKAGQKPRGYYITSYTVELKDGFLGKYRRIQPDEKPDEGKVWHAYLRLASESPWYNNQTYIDVFNREAVKRFIEVTHERYFNALGKDFGEAIPAIFTDEPHMTGKMAFTFADSDKDITLSYTDDMDKTFHNAFGVNLLDILPEILWELPDGCVSVNRYHYHDHIAERFASAFSDTIADWCGEHNIAMTGHYLSERSLYSQTLALSEAMRCYRKQQIPGIDILCDQKEFSTAKQAVSVARQTGRNAVISELYGVTHWDYDFKGHKLQGDWQAALGVTIRCHHLAFMSMEGEAKRDWPASISYQSPWYEKYPYIENHFARVNTALTRGSAVVNVGVIHPIESFWINYGPNNQTQTTRDQLDENYENLMRWLLYGNIDFDLISESMLPEQAGNENNLFTVGEMKYSAVIIPDCLTIRSTTLELLKKFRQNNGTVIFAGRIPELVDAIKSDAAKKLAEISVVIPYSRESLLNALEKERVIEIRQKNGKLSDNLFYQMRRDGNHRWLFICHVNPKKNMLDAEEKYTIILNGKWDVTIYDTFTGETHPINAEIKNGRTYLELGIYAHDSLLLMLEETAGVIVPNAPAPVIHYDKCVYYKADGISLSEPNVLLLDYARYSLNGGGISENNEILKIDNELRAVLGYPRRQDAITQPWRIPDEEYKDTVTLYYNFYSETETDGVLLAIERPENAEITFNNHPVCTEPCGYYVDEAIKTVVLPSPVIKGSNELTIKLRFGRKTHLENIYLLGRFDVALKGNRAVITNELEKTDLGDVTRMGLPFYTGNLSYHFTVNAERDMRYAYVEIPHFAGTALEVFFDGESKGMIAFAPHRLQFNGIKSGTHELKIRLYGNRFNGFGTLHNSNTEFMWYGPDSYRTSGSQWTDSYLVRAVGILSRMELYMSQEE